MMPMTSAAGTSPSGRRKGAGRDCRYWRPVGDIQLRTRSQRGSQPMTWFRGASNEYHAGGYQSNDYFGAKGTGMKAGDREIQDAAARRGTRREDIWALAVAYGLIVVAL